ncbi:MAG: hypothetical protein JSS02_30010 [Planctomycetes bacterium]|nr:hypothetical protein [Planctomycetota bacterium]
MRRLLGSMILIVAAAGCCGTKANKQCQNPFKPPLNCVGNAYDGSGAPCYHPPGPFWCCLPGPGSTCRDPYLKYYEREHANCIGRHVADPNYALYDNDEDCEE